MIYEYLYTYVYYIVRNITYLYLMYKNRIISLMPIECAEYVNDFTFLSEYYSL